MRDSFESVGKRELRMFPGPTATAETPAHLLDDPLTSAARLFVRNNGEWPLLAPGEADDWRVTLDGLVQNPVALTLAELKQRFPVVTIAAVLECAGNGRGFLDPPVPGVQWSLGGVGCARFTGVRLADLLALAALSSSAVYTAHHSPDRTAEGRIAISRGLPLWKATAPETLLAYAINGEPLPFAHGGPLRVVAPGFPGAAWQKWLSRIEIRDCEHDGPKMTGLDYRLPARPVEPGMLFEALPFEVIEDLPVQSLVTAPAEGAATPRGQPCEIRGWAWSGHTPVAAVDLSVDEGGSWASARLEPSPDRWAWRRFRWMWSPHRPGPATIIARARDREGRSQPMSQVWNPRGYCNNACQRLAVTVI